MDVTITCPAGAITGTATATMREFHSIPYLSLIHILTAADDVYQV